MRIFRLEMVVDPRVVLCGVHYWVEGCKGLQKVVETYRQCGPPSSVTESKVASSQHLPWEVSPSIQLHHGVDNSTEQSNPVCEVNLQDETQ